MKRNKSRVWTLAGILLLAASGNAFAGPVTTDLWDSSRVGFGGPVQLNGNGSSCGSAALVNIFGGSASCAAAPDSFVALGLNSLSLRWSTQKVTVGSFSLFSPSNFVVSGFFQSPELNEIFGIRLYTLDSNNANPVLFYDSGTISHTPANDGTTPLLAVTLSTPVTSANWRMDIVDQNSLEGRIYRIIELDAFAPGTSNEVPEPSTGVVMALGLAGMAQLWRRRR